MYSKYYFFLSAFFIFYLSCIIVSIVSIPTGPFEAKRNKHFAKRKERTCMEYNAI